MVKKELRIEAKETISACGSLSTPPPMIASGLTNPNIGKNLHLHPTVLAWGSGVTSRIRCRTCEASNSRRRDHHIVAQSESDGEFGCEPAGDHRDACDGACCVCFAGPLGVEAGHEGEDGEIQPDGASLRVDTRSRLGDGGEGEDGELSIPPVDRENMREGMRILVAAGAVEVGTHRSDGQRIRCKGIKEEELE